VTSAWVHDYQRLNLDVVRAIIATRLGDFGELTRAAIRAVSAASEWAAASRSHPFTGLHIVGDRVDAWISSNPGDADESEARPPSCGRAFGWLAPGASRLA
jgi:hypothetical protein